MIIGIDVMFIMSYNMIGRSISGILTLCIMLMQMPLSHTNSHSIISHGGASSAQGHIWAGPELYLTLR